MLDVTMEPLAVQNEDDLYPTSDGQPMGETDLHADEMTELRLMLRRHFEPEKDRTYVAGNSFVYYREGDPRAVFSPDVFVVHGVAQRQRDTYKLWREGPAPACVFEITSKSTQLEDRGNKKAVCEMLGVKEYFLYDPRAEYLDPPLRGFRLVGGAYEPIPLDDRGELRSETLGLGLSLDPRGLIVLRSVSTGEQLLRVDEERKVAEAACERAEAERERAETERERAEAERRRAEAERDEQRQRAEEAERKLAELLARS